MEIKQLIDRYEGVTELPPNKGFKQKWFQKLMAKAGWYVGAPWCSFAVKVFWTELYGADKAKAISGSALKTYLNLSEFKNVEPKEGGLVVWRMYKKGKPTKACHIALVRLTHGKWYGTMEGNTSSKFIRDGQGIYTKTHGISWRKPSELLEERFTGLVLLGFIDPPK
jgi:hypothetical protein